MNEQTDYIVIIPGEDGASVHHYTKAQLIEALNEDGGLPHNWWTEWPKETDPNYWGHKMLIIQGRIVVPKVGGYVVE